MAKADSAPHSMYLPLQIVQASPGFAADIGSSLMKIVYRSNKDFEDGKPISNDAVVKEKGRVHLATLPRDLGPNGLTDFIASNCDLRRTETEDVTVNVTGWGGSQWQDEIKSNLRIKLHIGMEDVYFAQGLQWLVENLPPDELAYPHPEAGLKAAHYLKDFLNGWHATSGKVSVDEYSKLTNLEHTLPEGNKPCLPCLLVMCGSNHVFMLLTEKGELVLIDGIYLGGKSMMSFAAYHLGKKSFNELMSEIESGDSSRCDIHPRDLVRSESVPIGYGKSPNSERDQASPESATGGYGKVAGSERVIFPWAKVEVEDPENLKKEDIVRSMFRTSTEILAQMSYIHALAFGVRRIYFTGSFISIPLAREVITAEIEGRILLRPTNQHVEYHFLRHGGYCGALGAFLQYK